MVAERQVCCRQRNENTDAGAHALGGMDLQVAAMQAGERQRDGKAKARALVLLVETGIDLAEGAHGGVNFVGIHAGAGIADTDRGKASG